MVFYNPNINASSLLTRDALAECFENFGLSKVTEPTSYGTLLNDVLYIPPPGLRRKLAQKSALRPNVTWIGQVCYEGRINRNPRQWQTSLYGFTRHFSFFEDGQIFNVSHSPKNGLGGIISSDYLYHFSDQMKSLLTTCYRIEGVIWP